MFSSLKRVNTAEWVCKSIANGPDWVCAKPERNQKREVCLLRRRDSVAPSVEKVLQQQVPMARLERQKSKGKASGWGWTVNELETVILPSFHFGSPNFCTYCGDDANQRDHIIAVSYQTLAKKHRFSGTGPWCWSCGTCNRWLSNRYFDGFKERCEFIHWRLETKAKPLEWTQAQLERIDYTVRSYVKADMEKRQWWRQRADFYQSRDFYLNLESLVWEVAQLHLENSIGNKFMAAYFSGILRDIAEILYRR